MAPKTIIGIDLGTTFSLAACLRGGAPAVLPNALGEALTPSAVSVNERGELLVGAAARARATTHPSHVALGFKRDMGTEKVISLGGKSFTPRDLSALVLGQVRRDAEAALGAPVDEAVITVPAYFGDLQRQATKDAAAIAGLPVNRILNEPTAAALAYGLHERHREFTAAVLDLGGGTFDVTLLEIIEGVVEIHSSAGDVRLGGDDFDAALAELVASRIGEGALEELRQGGTGFARLKDECERAKKRLSSAEETKVALPDLALGKRTIQLEQALTRAEAEDAWAPLLERMRVPILRAVRDANLAPQQVDEILLVGGSTRMPCASRVAAQIFGKLPIRKLPPDEAVALGAAVQAGLLSGDSAVEDVVVTDVAPFTLGISTMERFGGQEVTGVFVPILERGTVIPASRVKTFGTVRDFQTEIVLQIYQGEHARCSENSKLGEYKVKGIPKKGAGQEGIEVRFSYDLNGILEVDVTVVSTAAKTSHVIEQRPGMLTPEKLEKARAELARLKLHPRDALPNTTALARAEAAYVELTGPSRDELGSLIAAFRAVLERQDPGEVEMMRSRIIAAVAQLRGE